MTEQRNVIRVRDLVKELPMGKVTVHALLGVDLDV